MDGRLEVYGESLMARYLSIPDYSWESSLEWNRFADRMGIRTVMLNRKHHGSLLALLLRAPDWVLVHLDPRNVVYVRDIPGHAASIRRYRVDLDKPWTSREPHRDAALTGWRRWFGTVGRPWFSFETAKTLHGTPQIAGVGESLLAAVSLGAVFMGAMTYIGNGPNFMVKAIAEKSGIRMPSFFGFVGYSATVLLPLLLLMTWLFL